MDHGTACRQLVSRARFGALATLARDPAGVPFPTLVAVACDEHGTPLLLLSRLAEHTKNLAADARASLLVWEGGDDDSTGAINPLAEGRVTLVGRCVALDAASAGGARAAFLAKHADAKAYVDFADFGFWRLEVASARWIGGFGRMTWIDAEAYARATTEGRRPE